MSVTKMQKESMKSLFMEASSFALPVTKTLVVQNSMFSTEGASHQKLSPLNNQSYDTLLQEDINENHFANSAQHSCSVNLLALNEPMLSQELKKLRLKISDYNKSQIVDTVCQKIWRLMIQVQYNENMLKLILHESALPIDIRLYSVITPMFEKALGIYYHTNYYVARLETYKQVSGNVFYQRFVYDLISMFGLNLFYIDLATLEFLLRGVYRVVSHAFDNKVLLRHPDDVKPAYTQEELFKVTEKIKKKTTEINVKIIEKDEEIFQLDLSKYDKNVKAEVLKTKIAMIEKIQSARAAVRPFIINDYKIKQDPVKKLKALKKLKVNPLSVVPADKVFQVPEERSNFDDLKLDRTSQMPPITELQMIEHAKDKTRFNQFQIYQQIMQFNFADHDEALDLDEKYKKRLQHEKIMTIQNSRTEQQKVKKFMTYEVVNLKSHLYNKQMKMDKMFTELNAFTYKPQRNSDGKIVLDPGQQENSQQKLYQPKLDWSRDVITHNQQSLKNFMVAESARIAEEKRIINKRNSLSQRLKAPGGTLTNPVNLNYEQKQSRHPNEVSNLKHSLKANEINAADSLENRWTPNTKIGQDEQVSKKHDQLSFKTKSTLLNKYNPRPIYQNAILPLIESKDLQMVIDSDEKESGLKDQEISKIGEQGFLNSNQFHTSPNQLIVNSGSPKDPSQTSGNFNKTFRVAQGKVDPSNSRIASLHQTELFINSGKASNKILKEKSKERSEHDKSLLETMTMNRTFDNENIATKMLPIVQKNTSNVNNILPQMKQNLQIGKKTALKSSNKNKSRNNQSYAEPTQGFKAKIKKPLLFEYSADLDQESISVDRFHSLNIMSGQIGGPKMQVPIAQVIMGDFQLQNWRKVDKRRHSEFRTIY